MIDWALTHPWASGSVASTIAWLAWEIPRRLRRRATSRAFRELIAEAKRHYPSPPTDVQGAGKTPEA